MPLVVDRDEANKVQEFNPISPRKQNTYDIDCYAYRLREKDSSSHTLKTII